MVITMLEIKIKNYMSTGSVHEGEKTGLDYYRIVL